jgi:hypothetical protein
MIEGTGMGRVRVQGFVVTSKRIQAYGGIKIASDLMERIATAIRDGHVPMRAHHDEQKVLNPVIHAAEVRTTDEGHLGVWIDVEVDEKEWDQHGDLRAWSVSVVEPRIRTDPNSPQPTIELAADAEHFTEKMYMSAATRLRKDFQVGGGMLYQFSEVVPAKVVIEFGLEILRDLSVATVAAALYEALKSFLKPKHARKAIFDFKLKEGERTVHARLETDDRDVLRHAVDRLSDIADRPEEGFEYDEERDEWRGYL